MDWSKLRSGGGHFVNPKGFHPFSGDAITCWLDGDPSAVLAGRSSGHVAGASQRAVACGLAMQRAMAPFASVHTPTGGSFSLAIKVAIVNGPVRRFLVGDPQIQNLEVIAGRTLDRLALAEHQALRGQVLADEAIVEQCGDGRRKAVLVRACGGGRLGL